MSHKITVRSIESKPVRDDSGNVTKHRLSIPFLGIFTVYPERYQETGLGALLSEVIGKKHNVSSLNKFLRAQ
jgi:hypothetical protein